MQHVTYKGKRITAGDIERAMRQFDDSRDEFPKWRWRTWGVRYCQKTYPPKQLLRLAADVTVEGGGEQINRLFVRLGFRVVQVGSIIVQSYAPRRTALRPDAIDDLGKCESEYDGETEREAIIKARIGQGRFRDDLVKMWGCCAVTGCREVSILRASHIKPWRMCDNSERLDPFNGLLLVPNLDALFDVGVVSFDDSGKLIIAPKAKSVNLKSLGLNRRLSLATVHSRSRQYLNEHRRLHGFETETER
jgi:hypothetical protein